MSRRARTLLLASLLGVAVPITAAAGPRVLLPVPNTIVAGGGHAHVVVELDAGVSPADLRVQLSGVDLGPGIAKARANGQTVVHRTLRLVPGSNHVDITLGGTTPSSGRERRVVFYHEVVLNKEPPPAAYQPSAFHVAKTEAACAECHVMQPATTDTAPPAPEQSTCYACHAPLTRVKAVHGPAALWACTQCHETTSAPARFATPKPVMPLCFGCHQEQKERFLGAPYQHGPTATGFCTICHNPHGTDNEFFIKKAPWDLCTTCHFEKGSGRHVISWGPRGQSHPTRGRPDPSRVNRELSCASCHNPHAAPGPKLWNFNAVNWMDLCKNCHPWVFGA
ncbi:MAG: hypothetical protein HY216_12555 [Candidatus Rokubacteria bacterium]|nr:hypothetical protein [Candidatus Rokubacteria bacterium]